MANQDFLNEINKRRTFAIISNPDLVERWQHDWPLTAPDQSTFYTQDAKGYSDYPAYQG